MNFILDAHMPPSLSAIFSSKGHNAIHTKDLKKGNGTSDTEIRKIADDQELIVISKDSDFYYSHIVLSSP